jgi:hypothetical protein
LKRSAAMSRTPSSGSGCPPTSSIRTGSSVEWASFFKEHDFLVGVSIDGPRELHDANRVNKGGKGSFDQVMHGLGHLRDHGVEWNAMTTIHVANGDHGRDVYCFLRDECGARFIQFIPVVERAGLRAGVRRRTRQLDRRAARPLHPLRDVWFGGRAGAHRRLVLVRSLRGAAAQARELRETPLLELVAFGLGPSRRFSGTAGSWPAVLGGN